MTVVQRCFLKNDSREALTGNVVMEDVLRYGVDANGQ